MASWESVGLQQGQPLPASSLQAPEICSKNTVAWGAGRGRLWPATKSLSQDARATRGPHKLGLTQGNHSTGWLLGTTGFPWVICGAGGAGSQGDRGHIRLILSGQCRFRIVASAEPAASSRGLRSKRGQPRFASGLQSPATCRETPQRVLAPGPPPKCVGCAWLPAGPCEAQGLGGAGRGGAGSLGMGQLQAI